MSEIRSASGDGAYLHVLRALCERGQQVSPRGMKTLELLDVTITIKRPELAPPLEVRKGLNLKIAATETVHLLGGMSSLEQLDTASNGRFNRYADEGRLLGAYGPRLAGQLVRVEDQLRADPDTRQAVAVVWNRDEEVSRDTPCTVAVTFRVRDGRLGLKVHMRSNDAHLGIPYDWFMFSRLQLAMAEVLGLPPGPYVHHVDSLHLYQRDLDKVYDNLGRYEHVGEGDEFLPASVTDSDVVSTAARAFSRLRLPFRPNVEPWSSWVDVREAARTVAFHRISPDDLGPHNALTWWYDRVPMMPFGAVLCTGCGYVVPGDQADLKHDTVHGHEGPMHFTRPLCVSCHGH